MNFTEIKARLNALRIEPKDLADNFERYIDNNAEGDSIEIFNQTIEGQEWSEMNAKIDTIFKENFGEINSKRERINDDVTVVVHFIEHDIYVMIEGYYSSYEGDNYEDSSYVECKPVQKTITIYQRC